MGTKDDFAERAGIDVGKLSVVIATINDSVATNLTVAQIIYQLEQDEIDYEIVLVDNGSDIEELRNIETFLRFHKDFPISFYQHPIKGYIPVHAFGIERATGKYITMPDPHMVFSPHYFKTLIKTLDELQSKGGEVVFAPFSVGSMTKKGGDYICGNSSIPSSPYGKGAIGEGGKMTDQIIPVVTNALPSFITTREWMMKIGNMFPDAFEIAGGMNAESIFVGYLTWMFGKKCYLQPSVVAEHPVYRDRHGGGRNVSMHLSMAVAAYITGGDKYLAEMPGQYGEYNPGELESIPKIAKRARDYVLKNQVYDSDFVRYHFEELK